MNWEEERNKRILSFFNSATRPDDIIDAVKDDPDFGSDSPLAYGVRRDTAERILQVREDLGGEFTSIEQIDQIKGIGLDTLHDIMHNLAPPSQSYPVLLFPVRIETRFIENELRVRIYPDDVLIQKHDGRLTPDEAQSLEQYQEVLNQANTKDKKKEAWHGLVERVGRTRAAYLHRIKDIDAVGRKPDSWEKSPYVKVLPDHFLVCLYQGDDLKHQVRGKRIKKDLPLVADPTATTTETDPLYGNQAKWIYDFNEAENNGMAVRIPLTNNEKEFSRVVVLGLNRNNEGIGKDLVESLLEDHRLTSGLSFVPYGTPTNNTEALTADYTANEDAQSSFDAETQKLNPNSVGIKLAKALGIETLAEPQDDSEICPFAYVRNAEVIASKHGQSIRAALWPALGDYFLTHMFRPSIPVVYRKQIWRHFQHFVQARGPYSTIRIGKQPYGIIPVTDLSNWQPSELDSDDTNSHEFFAKFHKILLLLFRYWLTTAEDETSIPRIGQSGDTDEELLQILSMQPASIDQKVRAIVDDRFLANLIRLLSNEFFGEETNIEPGTGTDDPKELWGQLLYESQAGARVLLKEIAMELGIAEEGIFQSPILRLFGWVESVPLWNENTEELIPFVADLPPNRPLAYLDKFTNVLNNIPSADLSNPLLYDLLRRAIVYQSNEQYRLYDQPLMRDLIKDLAENIKNQSAKAVEELVRDVLDLHTHRLDAWLTSFAIKRLTAMRKRTEFEQGVYVGAYGWVENLERDQQTFSENSGGYIHAHSLGQAAAGAALRNAYLSEIEEDQDANAFRINLSSNRIRRAWRLMEGRRQGQEMGALLGYQFERALHDSSLDKYIDNFRDIYPLVAKKVTEPEGNQSVETIAARNVVDGLKLTRDWEAYLSDETPQPEKDTIRELWDAHNISIDALKDDPTNKLSIQLNRLLDSLDGLADLLLYESVYQEVQGNYERSAAALDAMSGEGLPQEPESIQTPQNGVPFTQRISLMFKPHTGASNGYRASAEPTLADWFSNVLGDMAKVGCVAEVLEYRNENDEVLTTKEIIDFNNATLTELEKIPGIGETLAKDIITEREKGAFTSVKEMKQRISGIGDAIVEGLSGLAFVTKPLRISLDNLNLNPLDFLYLSHASPAAQASALGFKQPSKEAMRAGNTEIEQRIRNYVSKQNLLDPNCVIAIDFHPAQGVFERSIGEALEMARTVLDMITSSKYLSPLAFRRPEETGTDPVHTWDYNELHNRVDTALDELKKLKDDARWNSTPVDPSIYFEVSQFGIDNAISPSPLRDPHPDRKKAMLEAIEKRIAQSVQYIEDADKLYSDGAMFSDKTKAVEKMNQAMKALFGDAFVMLPTLRPLRPRESTEKQKESLRNIKNASGQPDILGNNDEQRIYLWLQQVAQTHPSIQQLETVMMVTEAWQQSMVTDTTNCTTTSVEEVASQQWKILQLSYDEKRRWLALSDAELEEGLSQDEIHVFRAKLAEDGRERGVLSFVTASPDPIDFGKKITGLFIDDWNEWIPSPSLRTGVAFQYDRPNAQAPQALLLAVPPVWEENNERPWTYQTLLNIVNDTINLAKIRAVDIDALGSAENRFFPATLIPSDADNPMWERDEVMPGLDDWLTLGSGCVDFRTMPINENFSDRQEGEFQFLAQAGNALIGRRNEFRDISFLRIPNEGVVITLSNDVSRVKVVVAVFPLGDPVRIKLENAAGETVKQFSPPATIRPVTVTGDVAGIRKITVTGGGGHLALFEICAS